MYLSRLAYGAIGRRCRWGTVAWARPRAPNNHWRRKTMGLATEVETSKASVHRALQLVMDCPSSRKKPLNQEISRSARGGFRPVFRHLVLAIFGRDSIFRSCADNLILVCPTCLPGRKLRILRNGTMHWIGFRREPAGESSVSGFRRPSTGVVAGGSCFLFLGRPPAYRT